MSEPLPEDACRQCGLIGGHLEGCLIAAVDEAKEIIESNYNQINLNQENLPSEPWFLNMVKWLAKYGDKKD